MALTSICECGHAHGEHWGYLSACTVFTCPCACYVFLEARDFDVVAASRQGASRQAEDEDAAGRAIHVDTVLAELGIRVAVGTLVPTGPAVRLDIDDTARWLEPDEAHTLASALNEAATFAVHEDRAARRG